jgi:hypothetical protein
VESAYENDDDENAAGAHRRPLPHHFANVFLYTNMLTLALMLTPAQDGDTVVIGDLEFDYSSDKSEAGMYDRWFKERKAAGIVGRGQARWPHATG